MIYLYVVRHQASGLLWFGKTNKDPSLCEPEVRHWKWKELVAETSAVELLQVREFYDAREATRRQREFRKEHLVKQSVRWINSDCYADRNIPYVYMIRHLETGQLYVGSSYGKKANPSLFGKNYRTSSHRVKDLGFDSFDILEIKAKVDARNHEAKILQEWYHTLGRQSFCELFLNRNLAPGFLHDDATYARISAMKIGNQYFLGKTHSEDTKSKISAAMKGRPLTKEHCVKLSIAQTGKVVTKETRNRMREAQLGISKPCSTEHKMALSKALSGRRLSDEHKLKMSIIRKGRKHSAAHCASLSKALKGRTFSLETKAKMSAAATRRCAAKVNQVESANG